MAPRPKSKITASCPANQEALERLIEKRTQLGSNDRYSFTLKKGLESLKKSAEPIDTYDKALKLPGVGPHIARLICPQQPTGEKPTTLLRKRRNTAAAAKGAAALLTTSSSSSLQLSQQSPNSINSLQSAASRRRQRTAKASTARSRTTLSQVDEQPEVDEEEDYISAKERAYQHARASANNFKSHKLQWRVVLLVDRREQKAKHILAKCQMSGIPCEERQLPIGDMVWIAQGLEENNDTTTNTNAAIKAELVLGTIIERKSTEDLKASLFGTRYMEQRLRLKNCGLPQVLFLIEGDMSKELFRCPTETLHTAVWETRLHMGFSIVHTAHMDDTVRTLKRMHRRILQRTFPNAFFDQALPVFAEADASGVRQQQMQQQQQVEDNAVLSPMLSPMHRRRRLDRGHRRRLQSLAEMMFDTDPVVPLGMDRFVTYAELKAKIERDREAGTRTIGNIHAAMLKQVTSISARKCQAILQQFPTPHSLFQAYDGVDGPQQQHLVADLCIDQSASMGGTKRIGLYSSQELYIAYGISAEDDPVLNEVTMSTENNRIAATSVHSSTAIANASRCVAVVPNKENINSNEWWRDIDDDDERNDSVSDIEPDSKPAAKRKACEAMAFNDEEDCILLEGSSIESGKVDDNRTKTTREQETQGIVVQSMRNFFKTCDCTDLTLSDDDEECDAVAKHGTVTPFFEKLSRIERDLASSDDEHEAAALFARGRTVLSSQMSSSSSSGDKKNSSCPVQCQQVIEID